MKKILLFFVLIVTCITCGDKTETEQDVLEINTSSLAFSETAGSQYVSLTSNVNWTATTNGATWLECIPAAGSKNARVQLKASANSTSEVRTATVTFKTTGGLTATLNVVQAIADPYILIQSTTVEALAAGQEISIDVNANYPWDIQIPGSDLAWVSLKTKTETNVVLEVKANDTDNARTTAIVFQLTGKEVKTTLTLSQKKIDSTPTIEINPQKADVAETGGNVLVNVSSGVEWDSSIPASDTWVTRTSKTNNQATFSVAENLTGTIRTSNVKFTTADGGATATYVITQAKGYALTSQLNVGADQVGKLFGALDTYVKTYGFDYSENPHCTGGYGGHNDGVHLAVEQDNYLNKYVFRFDIHIDPVIDGDRCNSTTVDRQRNELKSATNNTTWAKVQGNYDEWQVLEWKFKLPAGFQPTSSFCHIHQIKAQDGTNNGSPVITITPRAASGGGSKRMQIIHTMEGGTGTSLGTFVDNIPLSDFEDEWVQVREEIHYTHQGYYACKITRIRDGKVLVDVEKNNIDMWRKGSSYIRNKFGIYRNLAGGNLSKTPVGQSALLKNESIWMCDFKVYEKNSNPTPGAAHD